MHPQHQVSLLNNLNYLPVDQINTCTDGTGGRTDGSG